jgi:hypothetical protein
MRFLRSTFSTSARVSAWKSAGLPSIHTCTGPAQRLPPRTPHRKAGFEPSLGGAGQASRARGERFARRAWRARCRGRGRGTHLDALSALRQDLAERHNPGRANAAHASADEWVDNSSAQMSCPAAARLLDILQGRAAGWFRHEDCPVGAVAPRIFTSGTERLCVPSEPGWNGHLLAEILNSLMWWLYLPRGDASQPPFPPGPHPLPAAEPRDFGRRGFIARRPHPAGLKCNAHAPAARSGRACPGSGTRSSLENRSDRAAAGVPHPVVVHTHLPRRRGAPRTPGEHAAGARGRRHAPRGARCGALEGSGAGRTVSTDSFSLRASAITQRPSACDASRDQERSTLPRPPTHLARR